MSQVLKKVTRKELVEYQLSYALRMTEIDAVDMRITYSNTDKNKFWVDIFTHEFTKLDISRMKDQGFYFTGARSAIWRQDQCFELGFTNVDIFNGEVIA